MEITENPSVPVCHILANRKIACPPSSEISEKTFFGAATDVNGEG